MEKRSILIDAVELRRIEHRDRVVLRVRPHARGDSVGVVGIGRVARLAAVLDGDEPAVVGPRAVEDRFPALLRFSQLPVGPQVPVGRQGDRAQERHQALEFLGVEALRPEEELGNARSALGDEVGVVAAPLVGGGLGDAAQGAVGDAVAAQLRRLQIPGKAIQVILGVAGSTRELALETIPGAVEKPLAPTQHRDFLWPTEVNRRDNSQLR